ncbi:shikimate kinase [Brevibacillus dissolubilis]|uniref:shikimate kinase n=1 Tax=Brevibacillus dissolubilis TaxID=1844116 RepID=UPI00111742A0|nr:shikimate kinase [Brevibacillus dissolubilis]
MTNVILIGFMGTGKSTIGQVLAKRLERKQVDLDTYIVERTGMDIPTIFRERGEASFRDIEAELLQELLDQEGLVITTGGGAVLRPSNVEAMLAGGTVVALTATEEEIIRRVSGDVNRPLLAGDAALRVRTLLRERAGAYDFAPVQVETTGREVDAIVSEILGRMVETDGFRQQ